MTVSRFSATLWACLLLLLLIGYFLRATRLDEFPPGISDDEATNLVDSAYLSRSGRLPLYQDRGRPEPLNRIYGAIGSRLFGDTVWAFRYTSALWGMLSLAAVFWASQQCFAEQPRRLRQLIGLLALASLTVALGHIAINRSIYRAVPLVAFAGLAAGFSARALQRYDLRDYINCGVCLALGCYTYTAGLALPLAYLPLAVQLAVFRRAEWRRWSRGLVATALTLFVLTLPISFLLLTAPETILARASDRLGAAPADWLAKIGAMIAQFIAKGDINPQYNAANAALAPPLFAPFFLAGFATLLLQIRQPRSTLILSMLIAGALPALLTSVTNGVRIYVVFALIPLVIGASFILPFNWLRRFAGSQRAIFRVCLASLMALALIAAVEARRIYVDYWLTAGANWRTWRIHNLDLSHSEWFFRTDRKFLADWISAQDDPLLIPFSQLDHPTLRALLLASFPDVRTAEANLVLPPNTRVVAPWSLADGAYLERATRLAMLHDRTITVLPPLPIDERPLVFSNIDDALELDMPASGFPAVARIQSLPPGWSPNSVAFAGAEPIARFNGDLELRGYSGPDTIAAPGDYEFVLDWSVARPVGHEYGAFLQALAPDWQVIAGADQPIWRWLYPTVLWRPGEMYSLVYSLAIDEPLPPGAYRLVAGAWHINGKDLPAESFVGHATDSIAAIGWLKVPQAREPSIPADALPLAFEFGDMFRLRHIRLDRDQGATIVELFWSARESRPAVDATVFLHALDGGGGLTAQSDLRPWDGRYPTFIWDAGEIVATRHRLDLPRPDEVELMVGMYTGPGATRLQARSNGERLPDDIARLGDVVELLARNTR